LIQKIIHTLGSRAITMLLNLVMLFITTRWMGAQIKGEIGLLVLDLSVAAIFSALFGGPALVYLAPRFKKSILVFINYSWSLLTAVLVTVVFFYTDLPLSLSPWLFLLMAVLECLNAANLMFLLGREKIKEHNWGQIIKALTTVFILVVLNYQGELSFYSFAIAYTSSLLLTFLITSLWLVGVKDEEQSSGSFLIVAQQAFKHGAMIQVGSIAQLFNYRLSYYVIELVISPVNIALIRIGIFHTAIQIAEALWQFARSISTVQYATVSNLDNRAQGLEISLKLAKLNYVVTSIGILVLWCLPAEFYAWLFGAEFSEVKNHILWLSPGIFMLAISNAFSHFFAGVGDNRFNTYSSIFGLALTLLIVYPSVTYLGTIGAAITASVTYSLQTVYQYWFLKKSDNIDLKMLIANKDDLEQLKLIVSKVLPSNG
jgi:O-antigen/teichoic acid export membrane protein